MHRRWAIDGFWARAAVAMVLAAACASGSGCSPAGTPATAVRAPADVAAEVKAAIRTQLAGYAEHDPAKAGSIAAPDIVTVFHGEPNLVGKAAVMNAITAQLADPAVKLAVSNETVDVAAAGDLAIYRATYRFTFTEPQSRRPASETGNWVAVFKRQPDGTMKMSLDVVADSPATAAA